MAPNPCGQDHANRSQKLCSYSGGLANDKRTARYAVRHRIRTIRISKITEVKIGCPRTDYQTRILA